MNDRIRDIALDCMVRYINDGDAWSFTTDELEKFGETIVRECAAVCYEHSFNAGDVDTPMGFAYSECGDDIKRSFGVEE